nr:MAG TPA: helix-turn-helix domain protein [Caudoviricetes sp.]
MDRGLQHQPAYRKALMSISEDHFQQGNAPVADAQAMFPNGWTRTDNDVWDLDMSLKAKALFSVFQKFRDNKTGYCWPSHETLAKMLSMSRRTVVKAVEELVQAGLVRKEARYVDGGLQTSNGYWVAASVASSRSEPLGNPCMPVCKTFTPGVQNLHTNQNHLTTTIQDFNSCSYVRNAREAETTENLNPKPECEESPSSVAGAPLRGGREKPRGRFWWTHAWEVWPVVEGLVSVPGLWPSESVFVPLSDWREVEVLFEGHRGEGRFPATPEEFLAGVPGHVGEPFLDESPEPAKPRAVSGSGGAWGDDVPLPAPRHVYGQGSDASEDHAKAPVGGVQGSPVPSPTPDVPKRPRKPSWGWMRDAPKRWADDGKPTTIPPTFVPSPRHVAFGEAWGLDVESIGKRFAAKHLAAGTLVQLWDWHFAELLEMKRLDKADAEREAERLRPELEAAEAARQEKRREWSDRLEAQTAGAVPPTAEFLALRPKMDEIRAKYGMKPKPKGEHYGWRANRNVGGESHGGPRAEVCEQWDPGVFVHPGLDPAPSESGDTAVGGRGDDVRPLRRVEADGGERRRIVGEGEPGGGDRAAVGAELRARGTAADVDQPDGGRDRPVPEVRDGDADEDELGPVDVAAEFFAWRRIRDAQLAG